MHPFAASSSSLPILNKISAQNSVALTSRAFNSDHKYHKSNNNSFKYGAAAAIAVTASTAGMFYWLQKPHYAG